MWSPTEPAILEDPEKAAAIFLAPGYRDPKTPDKKNAQ